MYLCALMQEYGLQSEISRYQVLVGANGATADLGKLAVFAGNGILSFGTVIIIFLIGAICMFTVPSISTGHQLGYFQLWPRCSHRGRCRPPRFGQLYLTPIL